MKLLETSAGFAAVAPQQRQHHGPLNGGISTAGTPRGRLAVLPNEIFVDQILPLAVEDNFLPGLCATSRELRRVGFAFAASVLNAKNARRQAQGECFDVLRGRAAATRPQTALGVYVEQRAEALFDRARRHSPAGLIDSAHELALRGPGAGPGNDVERHRAHHQAIRARLERATALAPNDPEVRDLAVEVWLQVARRGKPLQNVDEPVTHLLEAVFAALSLAPGQAEATRLAIELLAEELTWAEVPEVVHGCSTQSLGRLLGALRSSIMQRPANPGPYLVLGKLYVEMNPPYSTEHRLGRQALYACIDRFAEVALFADPIAAASEALVYDALVHSRPEDIGPAFAAWVNAKLHRASQNDVELHFYVRNFVHRYGASATRALVHAAPGLTNRQRSVLCKWAVDDPLPLSD